MDFLSFLKKNIVVFDGAFGTMLQKKTDRIGTVPEMLNLERPALIAEIHRAYAAAGADVITANTFGANEKKVGSRELSEKLIKAAVQIARQEAQGKFVALDIGPIGQLIEPMGTLTFDEAYNIFARQMQAGKDADLILIETMTDLYELKAALLAARETSTLPVLCSMSFEQNGRTFTGCGADCFALTASPLADAVGVNCSLGPAQLLPVVKTILKNTDKPVLVQANAGLPDENARYNVSAEEFAAVYEEMVAAGARIIGGCCGTTPDYIAKLRAIADKNRPRPSAYIPRAAVCSATKCVPIDGVRVIGERINPTGKKAMKESTILSLPRRSNRRRQARTSSTSTQDCPNWTKKTCSQNSSKRYSRSPTCPYRSTAARRTRSTALSAITAARRSSIRSTERKAPSPPFFPS